MLIGAARAAVLRREQRGLDTDVQPLFLRQAQHIHEKIELRERFAAGKGDAAAAVAVKRKVALGHSEHLVGSIQLSRDRKCVVIAGFGAFAAAHAFIAVINMAEAPVPSAR